MAKPPRTGQPPGSVYLSLKSDLWQSDKEVRVARNAVYLSLKSDLWQSLLCLDGLAELVYLSLKSDLWQSVGEVSAHDALFISV